MKIKKEYILLALLIASSVGYLIFQKTDRVHYTLPSLEAVQLVVAELGTWAGSIGAAVHGAEQAG